MRKLLLLLGLFSLLFASCNDDNGLDSLGKDDQNNDTQIGAKTTPRLAFSSQEELQNFLEDVNSDIMNLKQGNISKMLKNTRTELRSTQNEEIFISLLDSIRNKDLKDLTPEDWKEVNNDEEELVYIPEDSLILDPSFASVLNYKREVQVANTVYRYMENGIYATNESNAILLEDLDNNENLVLKSAKPLDNRITFYPASSLRDEDETEKSMLRATNITLEGQSLTLENGVTIPSNKIRDLNYKDRGDANWITNAWTGIWGKQIVAINKYNSKKKMLVTFYDQDYLIYKNIGTQAKMQKKKFWIWWNTRATEMVLGWEAVELEESFPSPPFISIPKPQGTVPYPNSNSYEQKVPVWLSKDFPFSKKYTFFSLPIVHFDVTSKHVNQVYTAGLKQVDSAIKAKMKAENQKNTPKNIGIVSMNSDRTMRFVIGKNEDVGYNRNHIEKKFLSQWFSGEYVLGYSTNPMSPTADFKNINGSIKGSKTKLKRGIVYGAVKYGNEWRAARIIKTE